jgi:hypothetical protein
LFLSTFPSILYKYGDGMPSHRFYPIDAQHWGFTPHFSCTFMQDLSEHVSNRLNPYPKLEQRAGLFRTLTLGIVGFGPACLRGIKAGCFAG